MTDISDFTLDKPTAAERIAKRIARAGICSRREAEARITEGRVSVNGKTVYSPALNVSPADKVIIDGKPLSAREPAQLWRYYKPRGLVVSARDEKNRQTIFDTLPAHLPRLISIGRLDMDSEGLLLLTNDGDLARHLELPATGWSRKYRVRLQGKVDETALAQLADGITIDGVRYGSVIARLDRQMPSNAWLTVAIREGKNREVRRIMEHLGYKVGRLIRISYGPFQLGDLAEGAIEQVKARVLADQLGTNPTENAAASKPTLRAKSSAGAGKRHPNKHRPPSGREQSGREQNANNRRPASRHKTGGTRQR